VRIAKWLPECFELTGVLCRTQERAQRYGEENGVRTFASLDALLDTRPEFVVSCVNKAGMAQMVMELLHRGMPTLSETPYAIDRETLERLIAVRKETGVLLDCAEQYFLYPTHQAKYEVLRCGVLGEVVSCSLSMMHDYHGISMLRRYLGAEDGDVTIRARKEKTPIVKTGDRSGYLTAGEMGEEVRTFAHFDYADGRLGIYDFSGTQYHSAIRSNHMRILGTRGELADDTVRYLSADNRPLCETFAVHRDVITGTIASISFGGETVYRNPFRTDVPMNEDEIAIATTLLRMGEAVRGGERHYALADGVNDALLSVSMHEAADTGRVLSVCLYE
jgi:predicted dehydrogenase